jgi:hypothetical protein
MSGPYRAGILRVSKTFHGCARALPPEHRVSATQDIPGLFAEDWLVEGPSLPVVPASGRPAEVMLTFQVEQCDGAIRLMAYWWHAQATLWTLGEWPNFAAFERDFGREYRELPPQ